MNSIHVVLVHPEIHWNTGNAGRTCLATGATLHLVEPLGFSLDERQVRRAGLDYWEHVDLRVWPDWAAFEQALPGLGEPFFFSTKATKSMWDAPLGASPDVVLVFGRETGGLPPEDPGPLWRSFRRAADSVAARPVIESVDGRRDRRVRGDQAAPMTSRTFSPSSTARLTKHDRGRFPGATLFDRLGRALCDAGCLPRKELYEAWEMARRVRRLLRGGRVVDIAGGHGLLAHVMLLLDDSSPGALVADPAVPASAATVQAALVDAWPKLAGRVAFTADDCESVAIAAGDLVVSCHACGALTDRVIARAADAGARVAVLPCCHDEATCDAGPLDGWFDLAQAVDAMRAVRLEQRGYRVWTRIIPDEITPKNRLLIAAPRD